MGAYAAYLIQLQRLLQNPPATQSLYATNDLASFINTARAQLAGEAECVRLNGSLSISSSTNTYNFSSISLAANTPPPSVLNVRQATLVSGSGAVYLGIRPYQWATLYWLNNSAPVKAQPTEYAQQGQGQSGTLVFNPAPDASYTVKFDCVCEPGDLPTDDSGTELIPYPYTDAVQFLAAYWAYMSAQRQGDADQMYQRYEVFKDRARRQSNASVLPQNFDHGADLAMLRGAQSATQQGGQ